MGNIGPKVSIAIPVYNGANYLHEAINSALAQNYRNIEVVVVNDGSDDGGETERIALSYGDRIRYFRKENGGVATALNMAIEHMSGDYFSWLSHDDMYTPDKISKQVEALRKFGKEAVVYCDYCHVSPTGKLLDTYRVAAEAETNLRSLLAISHKTGLHGCSLLVPRQYFDTFGTFDAALRYTQDVDAWFRMAGNVPFVPVKEVLVRSRRHEEQDSQKHNKKFLLECDRTLSRMIRSLTSQEVSAYCNHSLDTIIEYSTLFRSFDYEQCAFALLKHVLLLDDHNDRQEKTIHHLNSIIGTCDTTIFAELRVTLQASKRKPRIVIYSGVWVRGGAQRVFATILERLKHKYEFYVVYRDVLLNDGYALDDSICHIELTGEAAEDTATRLSALCSFLDADLFIASPNYELELLDVYEKLDIPSIACNFGHYFIPYMHEDLYPLIEKRIDAYSHASAVTWLTAYSANIYALQQPNGVLLPTPNTFDRTSVKAEKTGKTVLAIARFNDPIKRVDRILQVFAKVLRDHPDAKLKLVGPYNLDMPVHNDADQTIRELIRTLGMPKKSFDFVGEQEQVQSYYRQASLLVLTSESEGIPMVLNEAGTFGLPCVIHEITGLEDMITDGDNGFIVPQGDIDAMAAKVSILLADQDLRIRMGNRASELVERFSQAHISGQWEQLIDTLLEDGNNAELHAMLAARFMQQVPDQAAFNRKVIQEYERNTAKVLQSKKQSSSVPIVSPTPVSDNESDTDIQAELAAARAEVAAYAQTVDGLLHTVSWKVTRPLRWSKRLYVNVRHQGILATSRKIVGKLRMRRRGSYED